ncbi:MAG: hypothetical protein IPN69_06930 [Acidobacteria bacterium]|nr:hypothetical protein [Acidobacteriota bacterium]
MTNKEFSPLKNVPETKAMIRAAIHEFMKRDWRQLTHVGIYEPTISHRIALYLECVFSGYRVNIDCEYNRALDSDKYDSDGKKVRPDIIIHERFNKYASHVAFEVKKCGLTSKLARADIEKLMRFFDEPLHYKLGVFVGVLKRRIDIVWLVKGEDKEIEHLS